MTTTCYPFNEVDRYMWTADSVMRSACGRGNICVLTLFLDERIEQNSLNNLLTQSAFVQLSSLRLKKRSFGRLQWNQIEGAEQKRIQEHQLSDSSELDSIIASWDLNPIKESPLQIRLIHTGSEQSIVTFLWHHSLFDAHGAERFFQTLLREDSKELKITFPNPTGLRKFPFKALEPLRRRIIDCSRSPLWFPRKQEIEVEHCVRYTKICFSNKETKSIDSLCSSLGADLFRSCVYLGATARALAAATEDENGDFFVPVPHDTRRSMKQGIVGGNQLSFFFFRIQRSTLKDLSTAVDEILQQTQGMIEASLHKLCRPFFRVIQHFPDVIYRKILEAPTSGKNASFYLSDTGESLSGFTQINGKKVIDAVHYPPNFSPPGLTFVFSRFQKQLRIMVISDPRSSSTEFTTLIEQNIRRIFLSETAQQL